MSNMTFGQAVREWRISERLSLQDLAELLQLNAVQVGTIERDRENEMVTRQWPRIVADLARLGCPACSARGNAEP